MNAAPPVLHYAGLTDEQVDLGATAEAVLAERVEDERAGADLGWFGIGIPEELGGSGGTVGELAVVLEAAGAVTAASAVTFTTGVVGQVLAEAVEPPREALERLSNGALTAAIPTLDPDALARHLVADPHLSGSVGACGGDVDVLALPVIDGECSRLALVPADHPAVSVKPLAPVDQSRPLTEWRLDAVPLADTTEVAIDALDQRWRVHLALACALDAVGAARAALERTVEHAKGREQFGRPIGSFQAYKHRCATALVELKLGQALAFRAADDGAAEDHAHSGAMRSALAAGVTATRAALFVCGEAVQLHGAIGFTWEAGVHRWLKRARTAQLLADTPRAQRQLLGQLAPVNSG